MLARAAWTPMASSPRVKICGIRSEHDLEVVVGAGVDAVGLICGVDVYVSEDKLEPDAARRLALLVPPFVAVTLVTHFTDPDEILGLADFVGVDTIQLHGDVTPAQTARVYARRAGRRVTQRVHVTGEDALAVARDVAGVCDAIHLDSRTPDRVGGTGHTHDWSISRRIVRAMAELRRPVILAGGLTPANVAAAIAAVQPYAVDANSGVEDDDGSKSADGARAFVRTVRAQTLAAASASD
jgi:phosphoribosylanthranilate isomerase